MSKIIKPGKTSGKIDRFSFPAFEDFVDSNPDLQRVLSESGGADSLDSASRTKKLLGQAKKQAESLRAEAFEQGHADGLHQGRIEGQKQVDEVVANLRQVIQRLDQMEQQVLKDSEGEIVQLALEVARKVISAELANNPETVAKVIRAALRRVVASKEKKVRVNPDDLQKLRKTSPDLLEEVEFIGDPQVSPGGAIIETESGNLDAQIEAQLGEIEKNLKRGVVTPEGGEG